LQTESGVVTILICSWEHPQVYLAVNRVWVSVVVKQLLVTQIAAGCLFDPLRGSAALDFAVLARFCLLIPSALCQEQAEEQEKIPMTVDHWTTTACAVNFFERNRKSLSS
jgi:hypothetical protein